MEENSCPHLYPSLRCDGEVMVAQLFAITLLLILCTGYLFVICDRLGKIHELLEECLFEEEEEKNEAEVT